MRGALTKLLLDLGSGFHLPPGGRGFENVKSICRYNLQYFTGLGGNNLKRFIAIIYPERILKQHKYILIMFNRHWPNTFQATAF